MLQVLPAWITAFAAVGALVAATAAGFTAKRLYDIEVARDRDRDAAHERRQADRVAAWVSWTDHPEVALTVADGRKERAHLALRNDSTLPVYDVVVTFRSGEQGLGQQGFATLSPTGDAVQHRENKSNEVKKFVAPHGPKGKRLTSGLFWNPQTQQAYDGPGRVWRASEEFSLAQRLATAGPSLCARACWGRPPKTSDRRLGVPASAYRESGPPHPHRSWEEPVCVVGSSPCCGIRSRLSRCP